MVVSEERTFDPNSADLGIRLLGPDYSSRASSLVVRAATIAGAITIPTNARAIRRSCIMNFSALQGGLWSAAYTRMIALSEKALNPTNTEGNRNFVVLGCATKVVRA